MIISCDYSIRSFADAKDLTETLVLKNKATDENCSAVLAISGRQLVSLDVSRCHLLTNSFFNNSIPRCPNLKYLDLSYTSIDDLSPVVTTCSILQGLNLSGTHRLVDYNPLSELLTLQYLSLRNSYITNIDCLAPLVLLRSLDLGGTAINDIKPLRHCTRLEELSLDYSSGENMKKHLRWEKVVKTVKRKIIHLPEENNENELKQSALGGDGNQDIGRGGSEDSNETTETTDTAETTESLKSIYEDVEVVEEYSTAVNQANGVDSAHVASNMNVLKHLTCKEDANLRLLNICEMELGLGWWDQVVDMVHEDVCVETDCKKMQMVIAVVNNDFDACRRLLNCGLDIYERVGPWARHYLAGVWHSTRCGAEIEVDEFPMMPTGIADIGAGTKAIDTKARPLGCTPFFDVGHNSEIMRPSYLHLALYFCSVEIVEILMLMNSNPDEPVWLGEVVFDADDNVTEKVKQKSPAKRIAGLTSPAAKSEKDTIFNNCFALLEELNTRTVHRYVRGMVEQKVSNFKRLCNYYSECLMKILQGDYTAPPPLPEIRYQSGAGGGVGDKPITNALPVSVTGRPHTTGTNDRSEGDNSSSISTSSNNQLHSNSVKLNSTSAANIRLQEDTASLATSTSDWTAMVGIMLEGDESVYSSVVDGLDENQSVATNCTADGTVNSSTLRTMAIQNVNTNPVTLRTSNSDLELNGDNLVKPTNLKKKNYFITHRLDVSELQSRYSSLCWRKHDMVLKLVGKLEPIPEFNLAEDYQMSDKLPNYDGPFYFTSKIRLGFQQYRATKSHKIINVLGYRNYFLSNKKLAVHLDVKKKEIQWERDLKKRIENVRIYDPKLGYARVIKTATLANVPSDMARKQELINSIKEKAGDRW